jgi:REase_MTES_1575/Protein of unknown function (DUF4011)
MTTLSQVRAQQKAAVTELDEPATPTSGDRSLARSQRVADAAVEWADELATLGGRDPLLNFRDLKVGTLDLAAAEPEARKRLLDGESITVTRLFPHEPLRSSALRSVRAIRDKARELTEERGIAAGVLAVGIATWADPLSAHRPTPPVLLRPATVTARDAAETDFVIEMAEEPEVNPVLLNALDVQLGLRFEPDDLRDATGTLRYPVVVERLREFAPSHVVDGFSIAHRAVLGTFTKEPLALALDIAALGPELARNDVVAALAGDTSVPMSSPTPSSMPAENVVLDADWRQHAVVATAAAGSHLRVNAPAGTGRTQTIANLVAELVGRGKSVLVVSAKQARLRELVGRLTGAGLGDVVLDLSDGRTSSPDSVRRVAEIARNFADEPRAAAQPEQPPSAEVLWDYCEALHRPREPWGTTAYDAMVAVVDAPPQARTAAMIPVDALRRLDGDASQTIREHLREFADLEGLSLGEDDSAWYTSTVPTREDAELLAATVIDLKAAGLPVLRDTATRAAVEVGLVGPQTAAECFETVTLLNTVGSTLDRFRPEVWAAPLDDMVAATAARRERASHGSAVGVLARRRLRRQARDLLRDPGDRAGLHEAVRDARDQLAAWRERTRDGGQPRIGAHLTSANIAIEAVGERLATLIEANPRTAELAHMSYPEAAGLLTALAADEQHLLAIPRLSELEAELSAAGLADLVDVLREWRMSPEHVAAAFDYARNRSLLQAWRDEDPALRSFDPVEHERLVDAFQTADRDVLRAAVARVRAARARTFAAAAEEFAGQAVVVESGEHGPRTPRELLVAAPDVALAAVPCWLMSPLVVASVLPARQLFDVVIVEEAGRLPVAQAVPSLARAGQVVVVGDEQELTSLPFTTAVEPDIEPDEPPGHLADKPAPSVFEALGASVPAATLPTQYRARDDRLVGFSSRVAYRGGLVAVPGVRGPSPLHHEVVEVSPGEEPVDSATAEVSRVVQLVLEHARTRPHQSLAVVTLGSRHAGRIDDALRRALVRSPDAARFIREDREEPFFVKAVERATGDVRDTVILSLGYGRSVNGRVLYRFGALDRPGGNRLLAAAIGAARERLTVVSAFGADDLSPRRLTTRGAQALRDFLAYVEASSAVVVDGPGPADSFEAVIAERLRAVGADVVIGHGGAGVRIPIAARHPSRKDRLVLAVETDGPTYAAQPTVRDRDRLRPEQLARLGWVVHRVWSTAWLDDPNRETERLVAAYEYAVSVADAFDWAEAAAQADDVVGMPADGADRESAPVEKMAAEGDHDHESSGPDEQPAHPSVMERARRPRVTAGQPIGAYTRRELAALARWVESDGRVRTEVEAITEIAHELGLPDRAPRAEDSIRHAVRVARAGAPPLWPDHAEPSPQTEKQAAEVGETAN